MKTITITNSKKVIVQPTAANEWLVCLTGKKDTYVIHVAKKRTAALAVAERVANILNAD